MTADYETRSPAAYIAKPSEVKTLLGWSREKLEAYIAKSQPPQSWYDETSDPFADERDTPNPAIVKPHRVMANAQTSLADPVPR